MFINIFFNEVSWSFAFAKSWSFKIFNDFFDDFFKLLDLFREGYSQVNSKKIIFQLIEKMILDNKFLGTEITDGPIIDFLKKIP